MKRAFLLFGTSPSASHQLREAFIRLMPVHPGMPWQDVSTMSYRHIKQLVREAKQCGYRTTTYVLEGALPATLNESWVKRLSTYGLLRHDAKNLIVLGPHRLLEMVTHLETVLEADEDNKPAGGDKEPTESDRLRLAQQQELLATKQRQGEELLQTKQRELQDKSNEAQQKLREPKKSVAEAAKSGTQELGFDLNYHRDGI